MSCPGTTAIERAFPASANEELSRHIAGCASCGAEWSRLESLAAHVRELPVESRSAERVDAVRDVILATAARRTQPPPGRPLPRAALALAASVAVIALIASMVGGWPGSAQTEFRARVVAGSSARFTHAALPDEIVRLTDGTVSLDVEPLHEGERLRVVTSDAEVEVRGTSFVVEAKDDRLAWVHVTTGVVEVRVKDAAPIRLRALEHWRPASAEVSALVTSSPTPVASIPRSAAFARTVVPAATPGFDAESVYRLAFSHYMAEQYDRALTGFEEVLRADPQGPLAGDAAYQAAHALYKMKRDADALAAFHRYLLLFPSGGRAGDAYLFVGLIHLEQPDPDLDSARSAFENAKRLGPEKVRSHAQEGLDAIRDREVDL